jgi:hypothetical protein
MIDMETRSLNYLDQGPVQQPNLRSWNLSNVLTAPGGSAMVNDTRNILEKIS